MMIYYSNRNSCCNSQLDLFEWRRECELRLRNPAARRIAKRFGPSLYHAVAITAFASLGVEVRR